MVRTKSQLKKYDDVDSITEIKSETKISEKSVKEVEYHQPKAKLFERSETGVKTFQAGHILFDPIKYLKEHNITCKKFDYSVP